MGLTILLPYWIGELSTAVVIIFFQMRTQHKKTGIWWSKSTSKYFKTENDSIDYFNLFGTFIRFFLLLIGQPILYAVLDFTQRAHASLAVIASMFALAAFTTAFVFWILFQEKLLAKHYIGMTLLGTAIVIIS
jgi:drug/metabolite transporter (DMT)-like permease